MKKFVLFLTFLALLFSGCASSEIRDTSPPTSEYTLPTESLTETVAPIVPLPPEPVLEFSDSEKQMLLKLGMAELGRSGCPQCVALVMRTVLNRVESKRFGSSIEKVVFSPEQFTPVMDGSFARAVPNEICYDAYEMVVHGWDESQGALYYEFCEGESWHSQNLNLLFQHCSTRFYN